MIRAVEAGRLPHHAFIHIVWDLGTLKVKAAVPSLIEALRRNPEENSHAAFALGEIGDPAAIPVLLETVEIDGRLQDDQAYALRVFKSDKLLPIVLRHLDDEVAVDLLVEMKDARAIAPIKRYLQEHPNGPTSPFKLKFALAKMRGNDPADLATRLLAMLEKDISEAAQLELVGTLGETRDPRAVLPILRIAQVSNDPVLLNIAIDALATINNDQAIGGLIQLLERDYPTKLIGKGSSTTIPEMILRKLNEITGQNLGNKPDAWKAWLTKRSATAPQ
jgi:HEAT repeat protein